MNRVLFEPHEVDDAARVVVDGRRAEHLRRVLRVEPGRELRCGVIDGPTGDAIVESVEDARISLRLTLSREVPSRPDDTLLLAMPRPRVLRRAFEDATALGFGHIVLLRTWRVDKSHLDSSALTPASIREHLVFGLEQSGRTRLPRVTIERRFRPYVEDRLDDAMPPRRFVANPTTPSSPSPTQDACAIAIGPERGFTEFEVGMLVERGFEPVSISDGVLRVETAIAVAYARCKAR